LSMWLRLPKIAVVSGSQVSRLSVIEMILKLAANLYFTSAA
jgi:hypothetical protein